MISSSPSETARSAAQSRDFVLSMQQFRRHPERSRPKGGVVEGPVLVDASTWAGPFASPRCARLRSGWRVGRRRSKNTVAPLRLAALGSGRDDGSGPRRRL